MFTRRSVAFWLLIWLFAVGSAAAFTVFNNPLVDTGADPWMLKADDGFYYYMQTTGSDLRIRKVASILALNRAPETIVAAMPLTRKNVWAPELHLIDGKWFIYYAADNGKNENHRMYALESAGGDPLGPYVDRGEVIQSEPIRWSIDGTMLEQQGQRYFVWSGWDGLTNGPQNLYIAPMSSPTSVTEARILLAQPELSWEGTILEGPEALQHGTNLFLVYSANASWTDNYCLGMLQYIGGPLTNRDSWRKLPNPVFNTFTNAFDSVYAPGHCSFTVSPDGSEPWIIYHGARQKGSGWDRTVRGQPFSWGTDGLPFFGRPIGQSTPQLVPSGEPPTTRVVTTNRFAALELWTSGVTNLESLKNASAKRRPDLVGLVQGLEIPREFGDNYGARLVGYVRPKSAGSYIFYIDSSDPAELDLQSGPTNLIHLASTGGRAQSSAVLLNSNVPYSVQALMFAPGGEDFLKVTWTLEGQAAPDTNAPAINTANLLFSIDQLPRPEPLRIQLQPTSAIISPMGGEARLEVQLLGATPYLIQWMANGTNIIGATNSSLVIQTPGDAPTEYVARIKNEYETILSQSAKIWTFEIKAARELVLSGPAGKVQLERSSSLSPAAWKAVVVQTVPAGRNVLGAAEVQGEDRAYYRVAVVE